MGKDKSLLTVGNEPMINTIVNELKSVVDEIVIVSNQKNKYGFTDIQEVSDIYPDMGPLGGIHVGLSAASYEYSLVTACDLPFFDGRVARFLLDQSKGFDAVVPQIGSYLQPLFAVYSKNCLPQVEYFLKHNIRKVIDLFPQLKVNYVGENLIKTITDQEKVFFNINTPEDYQKILNDM
ncbi:MAG: molybdenum cofactor guanylyltransferase [Peptococcaceae bacterium]|nr:molybdenum cofactor guanylyltransferase [Peptococcaceae bacterium]